jgi:heptosyltransferase-1
MRILIVKLSSLGDVVHAMPVVHDIGVAHPQAAIDWVVEPGFSPLLRRMEGLDAVIECPLRRWTRSWWTAATRSQLRAFKTRLRWHEYDAILDLQGLTKSALIARLARGVRYGLANRTEGASHEWPARWLVDHALRIEPHIHALDRSRQLAAGALGYRYGGTPDFGLRRTAAMPTDGRRPCSSSTARRAMTSSGPKPTGSRSGGARSPTVGGSRCRRPARPSRPAPSACKRHSARRPASGRASTSAR